MKEFTRGIEAIVIGKTVGCPLDKTGIALGEIVVLKSKKDLSNKPKRGAENPVIIMASPKGASALYSFHLDDLKV